MFAFSLVTTPPRGGPPDPPGDAPEKSRAFGAGRFFMKLLMASLSMLFGASILVVVLLRAKQPAWPPPGMPPLPANLWTSTIILILSSVTMQWAVAAARRSRLAPMRIAMTLTFGLALAFLINQTFGWFALAAAGAAFAPRVPMPALFYYMLTALHAAHVVGGVIPMLIVLIRAWRGRYTRASHEGIVLCAMYWHYLDVVWLVLAATLLVIG